METAINVMSAFDQAGWIFAGLIMLLIGGALLAGDFYYRLTAMRLKARIKAVRVQGEPNQNFKGKDSGECYYPVYEYTAPDGKTIEAESNSGSGFLLNKEPGRVVNVLVLPHKPLQAMEEGYGLLIMGLLFAGIAAFLFSLALSSYETSFFTYIILAGFIAYGLSQFATSIKPRAEWGKIEEWQERRQREFAEKRGKARLLSTEEYYKILHERDLLYKKWTPLYVLMGLVLLGIGVYAGRGTLAMATSGIRVPGEIARIDTSRDSDGDTMYYSVAAFESLEGRRFEFKDSIGSSAPMDQRGEAVQVLYEPGNPNRAIIDRGIWNWAITALTLIPGIFVLWASGKSYIGINRRLRVKG